MDSPYMSQDPAAEFLQLSPRTLERLRVEGRGPAFLKFGSRVMYSREDLVKWAEAQRRASTSDPGPKPTIGRQQRRGRGGPAGEGDNDQTGRRR